MGENVENFEWVKIHKKDHQMDNPEMKNTITEIMNSLNAFKSKLERLVNSKTGPMKISILKHRKKKEWEKQKSNKRCVYTVK